MYCECFSSVRNHPSISAVIEDLVLSRACSFFEVCINTAPGMFHKFRKFLPSKWMDQNMNNHFPLEHPTIWCSKSNRFLGKLHTGFIANCLMSSSRFLDLTWPTWWGPFELMTFCSFSTIITPPILRKICHQIDVFSDSSVVCNSPKFFLMTPWIRTKLIASGVLSNNRPARSSFVHV